MSESKKLLELRNKIRAKRPNFRPQDSTKRKKIRKRWVFPAGMHSKMRLKKKGRARKVMPGFRSPNDVRGLDRNGLQIILVNNLGRFLTLDKNTYGLVISSLLGDKKRLEILKKAAELGFTILNHNHKDVPKSILQLTEKYSKKKQEKQETTKIKEGKLKQREEIAKKKAEEEKKKEDELASKVLTEEERKSTEVTQKEEIMAEQEKILTQKNI